MLRPNFSGAILIDTSAAIALRDAADRYHVDARRFFDDPGEDVFWCCLNATSQETFTRLRYDKGFNRALEAYHFLRGGNVHHLAFDASDEARTVDLLRKYQSKVLSFHDALCASVMLRESMFRVFTFDSDFWCFGFEVLPGVTG